MTNCRRFVTWNDTAFSWESMSHLLQGVLKLEVIKCSNLFKGKEVKISNVLYLTFKRRRKILPMGTIHYAKGKRLCNLRNYRMRLNEFMWTFFFTKIFSSGWIYQNFRGILWNVNLCNYKLQFISRFPTFLFNKSVDNGDSLDFGLK